MLQTLANLLYRLPRRMQRPLEKKLYESISYLDRDADIAFMNYGWASLDPTTETLALQEEDEPDRYCIQLYHRVASAIDLSGLDVLEVGCGRGGGAFYVMRYLKPRSLTGVDLTPQSIEFCRQQYAIQGLVFVQGRAEALEFDPETFDAVINVESSHCYKRMESFLSGVYRVLKPGGHFLFADLRPKKDVDTLYRQIEGSGLTLLEEENISVNVVKALELDAPRKQAYIRRKVPRVLQPVFNEWAGMKGTRSSYAALCNADKVYLRFVLQR